MKSVKSKYLLSVIIPTFNGGEKLRTSIGSIINQSIGFNNIELIIVDDCSNDGITKEILLEYQSKYPNNIKPIFMNKNSGFAGKPRNIGIKKSNSSYIVFSDDDDAYIKNAFEILYNAIVEYDSDIVIGNHYNNVKGENLLYSMKNLKGKIINMDPLANQSNFNTLSIINIGAPWGKIYKKEFILKNNIKFIENINLDDVNFYLTLLKYSPKVTVLPNEIVYIYYIRNDSMVHTYNIELFNSQIKGVYCTIKIFKGFKLKIDLILSYIIGQLLLVFSNLDNNIKKEAALKLYNLEKILEKEVILLNNAIMQRKFKKAIFISKIYKKLYNNTFIQKSYKKLRGL